MSLADYHRALRIQEFFARFDVQYRIPDRYIPSAYRHLHPPSSHPVPVLEFTSKEIMPNTVTATTATATSAASAPKAPDTHPILRVAEAVLEKAEWSDERCPITQEPFQRGHVRCTSCYHCFQDDALVKWLEKHKTCPVCRTECTSIRL